MGVKGLTSLLTDDPRRFGTRWTLGGGRSDINSGTFSDSKHVDTKTVVYIDGPALLHHLLSAYSFLVVGRTTESVPPIGCNDLPVSLFGQVSPEGVSFLARSVALSLSAAGANEIHLVRDGLASRFKTQSQVSRLNEASDKADLVARRLATSNNSGGINSSRSWERKGIIGAWDVPHLFAEKALMETFLDLQSSNKLDSDGQFYVHQARGEAEGYISHLIQSRNTKSDEEDIIILSNDTDIFIYNTPGYVPLFSLRFEDGRVSGWKYSRSRFLAAYPSLCSNCTRTTFVAMTVVSALAGNDYSLPRKYASSLNFSRSVIVQSNVGGLRRKQRNDPTSKAAVTAVIRYVCHFLRRSKGGCITDDGNSNWIWQLVKAATNEGNRKEEREETLFEALKIITEVYMDDESVEEHSIALPAPSSNVEVERLMRRKIFFCRPLIETFGTNTISRSNTKKHAKKNQKRASVWMQPVFVDLRQKMYDVCFEACNEPATSVYEYCRSNNGEFAESSYHTNTISSTSRDAAWFLEYCFTHNNLPRIGVLSRYLEQLPVSVWDVWLASLLLPTPMEALFLFMIYYVPQDIQGRIGSELVGEVPLSTLVWTQVALYHSNLIITALLRLKIFYGGATCREFEASRCFRDSTCSIIYNTIEEAIDISEESWGRNIDMDKLFCATERSFQPIKRNIVQWRSDVDKIWQNYVLYHELEQGKDL